MLSQTQDTSDTTPPDTSRAPAGERASTRSVEARSARWRRNAHQGRLHGYALTLVVMVALLIALAATNTGRVRVDWLIGSSRVSLVWLVLAAAIIGWGLGVLVSARFQWLTRARYTDDRNVDARRTDQNTE